MLHSLQKFPGPPLFCCKNIYMHKKAQDFISRILLLNIHTIVQKKRGKESESEGKKSEKQNLRVRKRARKRKRAR